MSQSRLNAVADRSGLLRQTVSLAPLAIVLLIFGALLSVFQYRGELGESDLYRTLLGILSGQANGLGLDDPLHYGRNFSFGYIELIYLLSGNTSPADRNVLVSIINAVGYVSAVVALAGIMVSVWIVYGQPAAIITGIVFGFSPIMLSIGLSGHQLLPALAFFGAASVALLAETTGWRRGVAYFVGAVLLFLGLTMRAELPLGFPWLVLAQRMPVRFDSFLRTALQRTAVCLLAFGAFLAVRHQILSAKPDEGNLGSIGAFFATFYRLDDIFPGLVAITLGCGVATLAVGGLAILAEAAAILRQRPGIRGLWPSRAPLLAPLALILCGLVFWLPNPYPARHFTFVLLGFAVLIGAVLVRHFRLGSRAAIAIGAGIVVANQAASEIAHPVIMARLQSPYTNLPEERRTLTAAPLGFFWRHAAAMKQRREALTAFGRQIEASCEPSLLVLSDQLHHLASNTFHHGRATTASPHSIGPYEGIEVTSPGRRTIYLTALLSSDTRTSWNTGQEQGASDALSLVLASEALREFQIAQDPYSRSIYDRTPIPQDRRAALQTAGAPDRVCP